MTQKIIIAKPGYNALTETDPDNLIYSSDYDTLKYHISGLEDVDSAGANEIVTVAHGLGYAPFFVAYVKGFGGASAFNLCPGYTASGFGYIHADAYVDSTNLYLVVHTDYFVGTIEFRYKIFRNRLGL